MEPMNGVFRAALSTLQLTPSSYSFMFPPDLKPEKIQEMVDIGVFPTLERLAPALTYTVLLSLIRVILQYIVIKV